MLSGSEEDRAEERVMVCGHQLNHCFSSSKRHKLIKSPSQKSDKAAALNMEMSIHHQRIQ